MNELLKKMVEREAKIIARNMRAAGMVITKSHYTEIVEDLMEISQAEIKDGRTPLGWLLYTTESELKKGEIKAMKKR